MKKVSGPKNVRLRPKPSMPGLSNAAKRRVKFGSRNARAGSKIPQDRPGKKTPTTVGGVGTVSSPLSVKKDTIWEQWSIPVCWEDTGTFATERQWVRSAIAQTWEAESKIRFTHWNACPSRWSGIRIQIRDENPHTKGLGNDLKGKKNGMVLNFTFDKWGPDCKDDRENCIKFIAVHEFGHALGIGHEQNRNDVPDQACADQEQGTDPDWNITPYDISSVMNYCNPDWNGNGRLSAMDIEGIRSIYGWNRSDSYELPGVGKAGEGAGAAFTNLDGGRPDLIMMAYDAPDGENQVRYRVGFNLDSNGKAQRWGDPIYGPAMGHSGHGAGAAIADINGNGRPDLLVMAYDAPKGANNFRYRVGFDLDRNGRPARWGNTVMTGGLGHSGEGAGVDLADINGDGKLDVILMAYDAPDGNNSFRYRVGFSLDTLSGTPSRWGGSYTLDGVGHDGEGAGAKIADFDGDGKLELVVAAYDAPKGANGFRYKQVKLGASGQPGSLIRYRLLPGVGHDGDGAGLAAADLDEDGWLDLVFLAYDAPKGANNFRYLVFRDVTEP